MPMTGVSETTLLNYLGLVYCVCHCEERSDAAIPRQVLMCPESASSLLSSQ
jgi:hypothetical protein